jgi:hypothetical protein
MGADGEATVTIVFGIAIPKPKLPDAPEKRRAMKDTDEEAEVGEDEDDDYEEEEEYSIPHQAFKVAHEKVFGSKAMTGLRLVVFRGYDERNCYCFQKIYVIEHTPSRVREFTLWFR